MKALDVESLKNNITTSTKQIDAFQDKITGLQKAVRGIVSLEDSLKGTGGEAIRGFYDDCHQPLLIYMYQFLVDLEKAMEKMQQNVQTFESSSEGYIKQEYLENDVEEGLDKVKRVAEGLSDEANTALDEVKDIVTLNKIDPGELVKSVQTGKQKTNDTLENLHELDRSQTAALEKVEKDLLVMKNYIEELSGKFKSGEVQVGEYADNWISKSTVYGKVLESAFGSGSKTPRVSGKQNDKNSKVAEGNTAAGKFNESIISYDVLSPFDSGGDIISRGTETYAFYKTSQKVKKGFNIQKYKTESGVVKYRVKKPELFDLNSVKDGRNSKIFEKTYIDSQHKRGNSHKFSENIKGRSGAATALKSKAGWLGIALTTGSNMHDNISSGKSMTKIAGDAGVDVGVGAVSLAVGGAVMSVAVGTFGAPVLGAAALSVGASIGLTTIFDGIKIGKNKKTVSDHIKNGVQTIAKWFK